MTKIGYQVLLYWFSSTVFRRESHFPAPASSIACWYSKGKLGLWACVWVSHRAMWPATLLHAQIVTSSYLNNDFLFCCRKLLAEQAAFMDQRNVLCILLIVERARGESSKWAAYIDILPHEYGVESLPSLMNIAVLYGACMLHKYMVYLFIPFCSRRPLLVVIGGGCRGQGHKAW